MFRIDGPDAVLVKPAKTAPASEAGFFQGGSPTSGQMATTVTADWLNTVQEEICAVIERFGDPLNRSDDAQLVKAILPFAQYGILPWSGLTNYPEHAFCLGMDGALYQALQASGPNSGGAQETSNKNYWKPVLALESVNPLVYPSAFQTFYEQTPPKGWKVRNGAVLNDAEAQFPDLWAALKSPSNAWKVKTLAQWTALSTAAGGVGGVPFFVLDEAAKTIKLPDTRGDFERGAGSSYLSAVGAWHGDAIRDFTGELTIGGTNYPLRFNAPSGVFEPTGSATTGMKGLTENATNAVGALYSRIRITPSLQVPVSPENRTRAFAVLPCVYVGGV